MKCPGCAVGALPGAPARVAEPDATSTGLDATSHPLRRLPTRCDDFPSVRADIYPVYGICNRPNEWEVGATDGKWRPTDGKRADGTAANPAKRPSPGPASLPRR